MASVKEMAQLDPTGESASVPTIDLTPPDLLADVMLNTSAALGLVLILLFVYGGARASGVK